MSTIECHCMMSTKFQDKSDIDIYLAQIREIKLFNILRKTTLIKINSNYMADMGDQVV